MNEDYGTLSETINGLKKEGYILDFNLEKECIICHQRNSVLSPDDFEIDKIYRFEGESNPDDESILYAISSKINAEKGLLVNGYGISTDDASAMLVEKLKQHEATIAAPTLV